MKNQDRKFYVSPLGRRYASKQMQKLFSEHHRITTWRKLWTALAVEEMKLGLHDAIKQGQIEQLQLNIENIDWEFAAQKEKEIRHDVMAHVHTFGKQAPKAAGIIHLGATSYDIVDNADLIIYRDAMKMLHQRLIAVLHKFASFCLEYKDLATLGYTHYQPAQPTTVGKRGTLWLNDFLVAAQEIETVQKGLKFRGFKGATGTQASFLALFNNNQKKVKSLDENIAKKFGFEEVYPVAGQTYSRIEDVKILNSLSLIASTTTKFAQDLRLLAHENEIYEPFGKKQVGSSAMPYKRNPMKAERICSLARFLKNLVQNGIETHQHQWFERSLDDSAIRRLALPEAFLTAEAILLLCYEIIEGIDVNEPQIAENLEKYSAFLLTEELMMRASATGENRQQLHEKIREYSHEALKLPQNQQGKSLRNKLLTDPLFADFKEIIERIEVFTGRASSQVRDFILTEVAPYLDKHKIAEKPPETAV